MWGQWRDGAASHACAPRISPCNLNPHQPSSEAAWGHLCGSGENSPRCVYRAHCGHQPVNSAAFAFFRPAPVPEGPPNVELAVLRGLSATRPLCWQARVLGMTLPLCDQPCRRGRGGWLLKAHTAEQPRRSPTNRQSGAPFRATRAAPRCPLEGACGARQLHTTLALGLLGGGRLPLSCQGGWARLRPCSGRGASLLSTLPNAGSSYLLVAVCWIPQDGKNVLGRHYLRTHTTLPSGQWERRIANTSAETEEWSSVKVLFYRACASRFQHALMMSYVLRDADLRCASMCLLVIPRHQLDLWVIRNPPSVVVGDRKPSICLCLAVVVGQHKPSRSGSG